MKLRVKDVGIETGGTLVAILNKSDAKLLDLRHEDRVRLQSKSHEATVIIDISGSHGSVRQGEIGLFEEVIEKLHAKENELIKLILTGKPESINYIHEKLNGVQLNYAQTYAIVDDIVNDRLTRIEKTFFVFATYAAGLNLTEVTHLTKAIVATGQQLDFGRRVFDKHCIGGIPANRTSMLIVPIVAAAGLCMPKTSSRAITSPAGTADTMEVLANVMLTTQQMKRVVKKTNGCIVWGGSMNLAPADDKIIEVEHPISLDVEGQMLASVMAKKASVGATHVLIDIPQGPTAKCKSMDEAIHLQHLFQSLGKNLGIKTSTLITNGSQPIGMGVGPFLESQDIIRVLKNEEQAPHDIKAKSIRMAASILEMSGIKNGEKEATSILESGDAWKKFHQMIRAQGEQENHYTLGQFHHDVASTKAGRVHAINNESISRIARIAGAPEDKGAGLYLNKKVGDKVKRGETLFTVYTENEFKMKYVCELKKRLEGYIVK